MHDLKTQISRKLNKIWRNRKRHWALSGNAVLLQLKLEQRFFHYSGTLTILQHASAPSPLKNGIHLRSAFPGGPVKRNVPLAQGMSRAQQNTQIGTEQGVASFAQSNENTNNNNIPSNGVTSNAPIINGDPSVPSGTVTNPVTAETSNAGAATTETADPGNAGAVTAENAQQGVEGPATAETAKAAPEGDTPSVDDDEDHQVKPVAEKGELQQTMIRPGGEVEKVYTGTPEEVAANEHKGIKQPLHTIVKPNGEIEKVYVGSPDENKKILNKEEKKAMKGGKMCKPVLNY